MGNFDLTFEYVFGSEEFNEFVGTQFNDVFGFFLNGVNIALLPDNVTPVSINSVNKGANPEYFTDNTAGIFQIEADGLTTKLTAQGNPLDGTNTIKLAIADAADSVLDSWILIEGGSFSCNADPIAQCQNVQVSANSNCEYNVPDLTAFTAEIDNGSSDSDGFIVISVLDSSGPFPLGDTQVVLTVTDNAGAVDTCEATVTVLYDPISCNVAPVAQCQNVQVGANSNCEYHVPDLGAFTAEIDNGSSDSDGTIVTSLLDNYGPYPLGDTQVVLTVTDNIGAMDSCEATITVVDDESISSANLDCGGPGVIAPPDAPLDYFPSYTKVNGCAAALTVAGPSCSFCNGAAKTVDKLAEPAKFSITDSGGVGDHIAWTNNVCDANGCEELKCTVCVTNPSNKLRTNSKPFTCPSDWNPTVSEFKCGI